MCGEGVKQGLALAASMRETTKDFGTFGGNMSERIMEPKECSIDERTEGSTEGLRLAIAMTALRISLDSSGPNILLTKEFPDSALESAVTNT